MTLVSVYTYEGVAGRVFLENKPGRVPFYRFYNKTNGAHFYTASEVEKSNLLYYYSNIFTYQGIACYVFPVSAPGAGSIPLYRFWSPKLSCHFYTASEAEKNYLLTYYSSVWVYEGVACYVYPPS